MKRIRGRPWGALKSELAALPVGGHVKGRDPADCAVVAKYAQDCFGYRIRKPRRGPGSGWRKFRLKILRIA